MKSGIVLCSDINLLAYACCAFTAIAKNIDARYTDLFLIAVDAGTKDLATASQFFGQQGLSVQIITHDQAIYFNQSLGRNGPATVTRLEMDRLLPADLNRVLYLDVDTLPMENLEPLLQIEMKEFAVAAVEREFARGRDAMNDYMRDIGMSGTSYFNAGVILFDWQKALRSRLLERAREAMAGALKLRNSDQCALNIAIDGDFLKLDNRWNARPIHLGLIPKVGIAHFVGAHKPWHRSVPYYFNGYRNFYRSVLHKSPWSDKIERESAVELIVQKIKNIIIYLKRQRQLRRLSRF